MEVAEGAFTTFCGAPAFSPAQRDYYYRRRAEIAEILGDYANCPDTHLLPIPLLNMSFTEWRKRDIKAPRVNCVHLALMTGRASKIQEDENFQELQQAKELGLVDDETYAELHAEIMTRKNNRLRTLRGMVKE
jgi:hypothetical protein